MEKKKNESSICNNQFSKKKSKEESNKDGVVEFIANNI